MEKQTIGDFGNSSANYSVYDNIERSNRCTAMVTMMHLFRHHKTRINPVIVANHGIYLYLLDIFLLESCTIETVEKLCGQYGIQTDFQLGAIHRPGERGGPGAISHLYTRIKEKADFPNYMEKPAGRYLYLCCRGRWDISSGYAALHRHILEEGLKTTGDFYACDLAGFILNSVEKNSASMISVRLLE